MNPRPRTRILLLAKGVRSNPATRYRFLQYAPYWEAAGLKVDFKPLFTEDYYDLRNSPRNPLNYWRMAGHAVERLALRTADIESAAEADMVLLENQVLPARASYSKSWYVFEWSDTNLDFLPNAADSFVLRGEAP